MKNEIFNSQLVLGFLNQIVNLVAQFAIIFFAANYVDEKTLSIYILFISMNVITNLFDFGFSSTIVRNISYILAGANKLAKEGLNEMIKNDKLICYPLLAKLISDVQIIYRNIAFVAFLFLFFLGGFYFYIIASPGASHLIVPAWIIFSLGLVINIYFLYYIPILTGLGEIQSTYKANIVAKITWLLCSLIVLLVFPNLISLSFMFLISILINRFICFIYLIKNKHVIIKNKVSPQEESTLPYITLNAYKMGAVSFGSFLINRSTVLISGVALPIVIAGQYVLSVQILSALTFVSTLILFIKIPELTRYVLLKDKCKIESLIKIILVMSTIIFLIGVSFFCLSVKFIIPLLGMRILFLPQEYLILYAIIMYLEMNHSICGTIITTQNKVPFVIPNLLSGIAIVFSSIIFVIVLDFGVLGLILSQGIIQLLYNNWVWPMRLYKEMFSNRTYD